jgi:signal transduction histidine kinase
MSAKAGHMKSRIDPYIIALAILGAGVLLRWSLDPILGNNLQRFPLFALIAITVWSSGYRPAILAATLGYLTFDFFFVAPRHTFFSEGTAKETSQAFAFFFTAAIIIGFGEALRVAKGRAEKLAEDLKRSQAELRELADVAARLREDEKRQIARELHDELAQSLSGLKMDIAWLREHGPNEQTFIAKLSTAENLLDKTIAETRRIASDLRPTMLDDLGLIPAAEWLTQTFTERTGIPCELAIGSDPLAVPESHATAVYRILQESLTNVARHAQATRVDVSLAQIGNEIALTVRDNGIGYSTTEPRKTNSHGLIGMRERAYLLGGRMEIESAPGKGTAVQVRLPLAEGAAS